MMMPTQSAGAGRFADFDLSRVPSPCFVIDEVKLAENLGILKSLGAAANANILLALKAFSMWELAPLISAHLDGCCASGLWEAKLAHDRFGGHVSTYAPAFKPTEIDEIARLSSHVIVNTPQQAARFGAQISAGNAELGLRVNPMHAEGEVAKYDPCAPGSRLGTPLHQLENKLPKTVQGLHIHTLCEQDFPPLARTVDALHPFLEAVAPQLRWLNLGGGHLVTRPDYKRAALAELTNALAHTYNVRVFSNWALPLLSTRAFWLAKCWMSWIMRGLWPCWMSPPPATCRMFWKRPTVRPDAMSVRAATRCALAGRVVLLVTLSALMVLMRYRRLATGWRFSIRRITQWSKQRRSTAYPCRHLPYGTATRMLCAWCARLIMPILKDACHEPCM